MRVVLVTISGIRGSTPREIGAKMIVTARRNDSARSAAASSSTSAPISLPGCSMTADAPETRRFPLGPALGQCCGGVMDVLFEPVGAGLPEWLRDLRALHGQGQPSVLVTAAQTGTKFVVTADNVFGVDEDACDPGIVAEARADLQGGAAAVNAGNVFRTGAAAAASTSPSSGRVTWAPPSCNRAVRAGLQYSLGRQPAAASFARVPRNVKTIETGEPALEVAAMPPASYYLVMTHSHPLDFDICDRILRRGDAAYCGLIGSLTKRRRFEKRFRQEGLPQGAIERLVCPIGVTGISGKKPAEIAIAAAAEILQAHEQSLPQERPLSGNVRPIGS